MHREDFHFDKGPCKPSCSIKELLDIMIDRGVIVRDYNNALDIIRRTGYYRLSAYTLSLKKDDVFYPETTFDNIYELYRCDDAFRKIVFDYASYVEIAFRAYISQELSQKYGPLGYLDADNFTNKSFHKEFIEHLESEVARSDDVFVEHHYNDLKSIFPLWVAIECASFGDISKLFKNMKNEDKQNIVKKWLPNDEVYISNWLQCSVYARNISAHGGRFYNRPLQSVKVRLPGKLKKIMSNESPFAFILAINKLLPSKALSDQLQKDLKHLFEKYTFANSEKYGFPSGWEIILAEQSNSYKYYSSLKDSPYIKGA